MAPHPFEDPRKADLRERAAIALDASGYVLRDPRPVDLLANQKLRGAIKGDLQSVDGNQVIHAFYVRTEWSKPLPQWLANLAIAAHEIQGIKVHVIVDEVSSIMERTCKAAGSGLLRLDTTDPYRLDQVVSPDEYSAITHVYAYREKIKELRRRLEGKLDMNLGAVNENYANVQTLTQGWSAQRRDHYISSVEEADKRWREWGDRMSTKLDELASGANEEALRLIEEEIERGAIDTDIDGSSVEEA